MHWACMDGLLSTFGVVYDKLSALGAVCGDAQKQPRHAEAGLAHVFSLHPLSDGDAEAVRATQRGVRLLHDGRTEEALREFHDARQLAPHSHTACSNIGCSYQSSGDDGSAIYWYREAHRLCPSNDTAVLCLALLEQRRGQTDEAQRLLVTFLQADSAHIGALRQLARLHQREGHWSKAAGCFHRLIAVDPGNSEWHSSLQACLDHVPTRDERGHSVARAFSFPDPVSRNAAPFEATGRRETGGNSAVLAQLQEAQRQRDSGRLEGAMSVYRNILRLESRNTDALLGLADCQQDLGDHDSALESVKQLLAERPDDPEANLRVGELLLASEQVDMAEPYLKRAGLSRVCGSGGELQPRLLMAAAEAALAREDHSKALASASEAVRLDASAPRALLLLGNARYRVADYQAALRALNAAIEAFGSKEASRLLRSQAHGMAAAAHERLRQFPQALQQVQQALTLSPSNLQARVTRAVALLQSGQGSDAEAELEAVIQRHPQHAATRLQRGYCYLLANSFREAVVSFEAALQCPGALKSELGASKIYLSLALDSVSDVRRAEVIAREGLGLHKNLQHVWREIESGQHSSQPLAAVQRLRGLCDLDLNSMQARQLIRVLARATDRPELARALGGAATPPASHSGRDAGGASSRQSSVPPARWAPSGGREGNSGTSTPNVFGAGQRARGSFDDGGPNRGRSPSQERGGGATGSRNPSPMAADSLTIGWNELIRPEQLIFGPLLGSGGSGQVFRGSWNGQEVAIKKISGAGHLEEMKKEINALRRLRHPRLVRFIGACLQPPLLLVVTEFMPGGSLHDRLFGARRDPPMLAMQRWTISCQMAEGMAFLHAQRVVHRDLKSMNILLDSQQNAKICDFGLAHQMCVESTHIARKIDGEGGSPRYMAPECYDASHGKLTEKVDVWAMGCILLEVFGGVLPYADCSTMAQLTARILVQRRAPDVPQNVPGNVAALIRRCVTFDPARRPASGELQSELASLRP